MKVPTITLILVLHVHAGYLNGYEVDDTSLKWNMTYAEAKTHCESFSAGYLPDDRANSTALQELMFKRNINAIWMGIEMTDLVNWTWADGDKDTPLGIKQGTGGRVCAGLSSASKTIHPKSCDYGSDLEGVICKHAGTSQHCQEKNPWYCFQVGSVVFSFKCGVENWYDARSQCQEANASIANLNTADKIEAFVHAKNKIPRLSLCSFFWIGLRRTEWMVHHGSGAPRTLTTARWLSHQPLHGPGCVTFEMQSRSAGWRTTPCSDVHTVICMISKQEETTMPDNDNTPMDHFQFMRNTTDLPREGLENWKPVTITIATLAPVVVLVLICCCVRKPWRSRQKTEDIPPQYEQARNGSMINLLWNRADECDDDAERPI